MEYIVCKLIILLICILDTIYHRLQIAIDCYSKKAFIFGDLAHQWIDTGEQSTPVWMKIRCGSAYRAFCGPTYDVIFCGINYPYLSQNGSVQPLEKLDRVFVSSMACSQDSIVCACSDGKLLIICQSELNNFTIESTVVMDNLHITHISVSNDDIFLLADSTESERTLTALPEYAPFDQPLNIVLSHIKNIPADSIPHFLRMDQTFDSMNL